MRRDLNPRIDLQELLGQQIFSCLQGEIVEPIREQCEGMGLDNYIRSLKEGHSLKVEQSLLPDFYNLCQQVKKKLEYIGDIDFYISGNTEANACAFASADDNKPSIIEINSGLFNLMNNEEMKFVIGHEIGHLLNRDSVINRLFDFIYPEYDEDRDNSNCECPVFISKRYKLYQQLAELGADRYGYMANENLDACVTAIFKLASGLFLEKMNVSIDSLMEENKKRLEFFTQDCGISEGTHPVHPIRVRAIELFARANTQKALNQGMSELVNILQTFMYSEMDYLLSRFIASAGLLVAQSDDKADKIEEEYILSQLAAFCLCPQRTLKDIKKEGKILDGFIQTTNKILELDPGMRSSLLSYLIDVAYADRRFANSEILFIYKFGHNIGFSESDVAKAIGLKIRKNFVPLADVLE